MLLHIATTKAWSLGNIWTEFATGSSAQADQDAVVGPEPAIQSFRNVPTPE